MRTVEFESIVQGGQLELPAEIAGQIPHGEQVHVVVMWGPADADAAFRRVGRPRFEAAYCANDEIYEQLIDDPQGR